MKDKKGKLWIKPNKHSITVSILFKKQNALGSYDHKVLTIMKIKAI